VRWGKVSGEVVSIVVSERTDIDLSVMMGDEFEIV